jgi:replicative DNA helicase
LRESGSIEQDADLVLFIYREDLYKKEEDLEEQGVVQLIIGKQRNGPTGVVKLAFIEQWTKFENLARELE